MNIILDYTQEKFMSKIKVDQLILDHVFTLFNHLENCDDPELIETIIYFYYQYDFDIDTLPQKLYDSVLDEIKRQNEESYYYF